MITLYGIHPVMEALKKRPRAVKSIHLARQGSDKALTQISELAQKHGIALRSVTQQELLQLTNSSQHQGIAAQAEPFPLSDIDDVISRARRTGERCFFLVLDCVQDPQNTGSLIRSAVCCGAQAVIFPKDRAAGLTPAVAKASAGAIEHISLCRVVNIAQSLEELRRNDIWVAGTVPEGGESIYSFNFKRDLALVIGGEGPGMRRLVREKCDVLLSIPMPGGFESLNASIAGAVVMFESLRQQIAG
ncbi:MAG: 23S rRNA (guanosine(2251)-2'-O)-methyltransferase RlmB [Deltaproteobacteria bacterium]|nr:23S rRNA (guanosine(2251)-2'-O)-methyltransferase RlmB [Deltaproteobacteria bacterium]